MDPGPFWEFAAYGRIDIEIHQWRNWEIKWFWEIIDPEDVEHVAGVVEKDL